MNDSNFREVDLTDILMQRLNRQNSTKIQAKSEFDPYQQLLNKKKEETEPIDPSTIQRWAEDDVNALTDYCKKMGILGFKCGNLNPKIALQKLKQSMGDYSEVPINQRIPEGWQEIGTHSGTSSGYSAVNKKQILHG